MEHCECCGSKLDRDGRVDEGEAAVCNECYKIYLLLTGKLRDE